MHPTYDIEYPQAVFFPKMNALFHFCIFSVRSVIRIQVQVVIQSKMIQY